MLCSSAASPQASALGTAPSILSFSPQGTVKQVRQVNARFSQPMVPLGDPRASLSPFDIDCPAKATAHWIDSFTWSYDFAQDLAAGVRCRFRLRAGIKSPAGESFSQSQSFEFDTGGPSVIETRPWVNDDSVDEEQAFILVLDAATDLATIADHTSFSIEGLPQRIGARVIQGGARDSIATRFAREIDKRPFVILQALQRFPNGAAIHLIWGRGIKSSSGIATREDQQLDYKVRKAFAATVDCERENPKAGCVPVSPIHVRFTADIRPEMARQIALLAPDGTRTTARLDSDSSVMDVSFEPPFKESVTYKVELPPNLADESGRTLVNATRFPYAVSTGEFPPLAKFSARFGIIESADPVLPVTVRNLEREIHGDRLRLGDTTSHGSLVSRLMARMEATLWRVPGPDPKAVLSWLRRVATAKRSNSVFSGAERDSGRGFTIAKPHGPNAFEVMGLPLGRSGLYVVELRSERLGSVLLNAPKPMYVPAAALVTNLSVHFKHGKANSLVWVTELESARPVNRAAVTIADCNGTELWSGLTDRRGIALVPQLDSLDSPPQCKEAESEHGRDYDSDQVSALRDLNSGVLVTASRGDDFSFVHSSWTQGIESWRFNLPTEMTSASYLAHTIFDRTLLRAGETVHMKHFIRARTLDGFAMPPDQIKPSIVSIRFAGGDQHYDFTVKWHDDDTAETDWKIPHDAKLGQYQVVLTRPAPTSPSPSAESDTTNNEVESGSFQVEEFRVPLMRAAIGLPAAPQVAVDRVPVDISAAYLSGGAAKGLPVILRSQISSAQFPSFPDFDSFTFANGPVKEGIRRSEFSEESTSQESTGLHQRRDLQLDAAGGARTEITEIPHADVPQTVRAELEFRDPNGETQTVANSLTVWPAELLAGIRVDDWASSHGMIRAQVAVINDNGQAAPHAPVQVIVLSRKFYSYRKRLIGGFYAYENTEEIKRVGPLCSGRTNGRGLFFCDANAPFTGEAILQVTVTDDAGNSSVANTSIYLQGQQRIWFPGQDDDRMDVIAEKPEYQPGDVAKLQVRMSFAEATALVTVEREGIIAASVMRLSGRNPVIILPVRDYAPNVFISVMAVRGRVGAIAPAAMVDLGKPAFKLGIAGIRVGWRRHRLNVTVTPARTTYHVRDRARVRIAVTLPDGHAPAGASSVAVAAVDEGLLELKPNDSWKLLDAMMDPRPYQIETSTAQLQIVGRRHYGLKAVPSGGGGGHRITRELFDTLLLWRATVPLDHNGTAELEVPLNDSLTSFRIVAIAANGVGDFGTGAATIRSTQDLQLFSGLPPFARTGDSFAAEFTVRNASERAMSVNVNSVIDGLAARPPAQKLELAPGDGRTITWSLAVPQAETMLNYHVDAVAGRTSDHLLIHQPVIAAVPIRTWQATLARLDHPIDQSVALPKDALTGQGGIHVRLAPSISAGLDGLEAWMKNYPYICLEQRVSRAVALHDPALWQGIVADLASYKDSDGLLKYFPSQSDGSDVLSSYVLAIAGEAGLKLPPEMQSSIESGLAQFVEGKLIREEPFAVADLPMRKLAAVEALARYGKTSPSMLDSIRIEPNLWPDSAVIDWWSILERMPSIPQRTGRISDAERIMRARLYLTGTAMHLASDPRNEMWWLMVSPDRNLARLTLLLLDAKEWRDELPKIMQGALALQQRGAWPSTIANAWGALALKKFTAAFEATPLTGTTTATISNTSDKLDWSRQPSGISFEFPWPVGPANLSLSHNGSGAPWVQLRSDAAIPLQAPLVSGYSIQKRLLPVDSNPAGTWRQGDLVRVHLEINAASDMTWVVVDDPLPAGASHLGIGLAHESQIGTQGENDSDQNYLGPAYTERAFSSFRAYYDYVPKGIFTIEYTIRLNQSGKFQLPPTRVEALYEPAMLGELPNAPFVVMP